MNHYLIYRLHKDERELHCAELRVNSNSFDAMCKRARVSKYRVQVEHNDGAEWALSLATCDACRAQLVFAKQREKMPAEKVSLPPATVPSAEDEQGVFAVDRGAPIR